MRGGVRAHHASRLTVKGCVLGGWACHGKINDFLSDFFRGGETRLPTYPLPPHKPPFAPRRRRRTESAAPQRDHTDQAGACFDLLCVSCSQVPDSYRVRSHLSHSFVLNPARVDESRAFRI